MKEQVEEAGAKMKNMESASGDKAAESQGAVRAANEEMRKREQGLDLQI